MRGTDSTLASNEGDTVFAYTHIPRIFFVSAIFPLRLQGWIGTKIDSKGKTAMKARISDDEFKDFLISRFKIASSSTQKTDVIKNDKIQKSIDKNPERFLNSESFKVMLEESRRTRRERIKDLPKYIVELIDIIDRSLNNPNFNSLQQKAIAYGQNRIANELSNLSNDKTAEIDSRIETAMRAAATTKMGIEFSFETDGIIGKYIICFFETKKEQIDLLKSSFYKMVKNRPMSDKRFIVVFTFNPLDAVLPYETAYDFGNSATDNK